MEVAMTRNIFVSSVGLTSLLASVAYAEPLKLASPDIKPNGMIAEEQVFNGFGCSGKNVSPALSWSGAPKGTKSFALLVRRTRRRKRPRFSRGRSEQDGALQPPAPDRGTVRDS